MKINIFSCKINMVLQEKKQKYVKMTQLEHIRARPNMYISDPKPSIVEDFVIFEKETLVKKNVKFSLGLYKIFDEAFQNAIDQSVKDATLKNIKVDIDQKAGSISIFNDGIGIPVEIDEKEGVYIPEMVFGSLLTSSNYNDSEDRIVGGVNGLGVKCTNVFSESFKIEVADGKKVYEQTFSNGMTEKTKASIRSRKANSGYVRITFVPELGLFNMKKLSDTDVLDVIYSRVKLGSLVLDKRVKLYLNGESVNSDVKTLSKTLSDAVVYEENKDWEVAVIYDYELTGSLSFVNGIQTLMGGKHVEYILNQLVKKISESSKTKVSSKDVRDRVFMIIRATVKRPSFSSQSKEFLTTSSKDFGYSIDLSDKFIKKLLKTGIIQDIKLVQNVRQEKKLKNTDGKKSSKIRVPKLDDANFAGTSKSEKCTLILTEGDSAKTFAVSGLSVIGRDYYGVFPLRGKFLNVREATKKQLLENEEFNNLKKIMGLQQGKVYDDLGSLRYGKIIILTDADSDGLHIQSLIINLFSTFWPSLLKYKGFLSTMRTPIVKATKGKVVHQFYSVSDYDDWKKTNNPKSWAIKYYKGLGTSTAAEAKEYFKDIKNLQVDYFSTKNSDAAIRLAFEKKNADKRKEWVLAYKPKDLGTSLEMSFEDFINNQLIDFSIYDIQRSIPSMVDGFKPSQRKVMYTALKTNLIKEYKVAQFAGQIAKESGYHHGEVSLMGTIIGMAQNYTGSNNINLLTPIGQFGTRLASGKDAASPRYIYTKMEDIATMIFDKSDLNILKYLDDDGTPIEPEYYVPVIPMVLVNGASGIGTGFSTKIPSFNPVDLIDNIKRIMDGKDTVEMSPYYRGFKGVIAKVGDTKYETRGVYKQIGKKVIISELPIGKSTDDYLEHLLSLVENGSIKDYKNNSTEETINITVDLQSDTVPDLKMTSSLNISNMYLFDANNRIKKYDDVASILNDFFDVRMDFYKKRKVYLLKKLSEEIKFISNKLRFLELIINKKLVVFRVPKKELENKLKELEFDLLDGNYNYLTEMPISSFTEERMAELMKKKSVKEDTKSFINSKTLKELWVIDLDEVSKQI